MEEKPIQFTIRGTLWATFWVALIFAAHWYAQTAYWEINLGRTPGRTYYVMTASTIAAYITVASLCAACGAIFGYHKKGLAIGLIAAAGGVCSTIAEVIIGGP